MTLTKPHTEAAEILWEKINEATNAIIRRAENTNSKVRWGVFSQQNPIGHRRVMGKGIAERGNLVEAIIEDHYTSDDILKHVATWDPYTALIVAHLLWWLFDDHTPGELPPAPAVALAEAILDAR